MKKILSLYITLLAIFMSYSANAQNCCDNMEFKFEPFSYEVFGEVFYELDILGKFKQSVDCETQDSLSYSFYKRFNDAEEFIFKHKFPTLEINQTVFRFLSRITKKQDGEGIYLIKFTGINEDTCNYTFDINEEDFNPSSINYHTKNTVKNFIIKDFLEFESNELNNVLELYSYNGISEEFEVINNKIDLRQKANGLYFLIIKNENTYKTIQILKI